MPYVIILSGLRKKNLSQDIYGKPQESNEEIFTLQQNHLSSSLPSLFK